MTHTCCNSFSLSVSIYLYSFPLCFLPRFCNFVLSFFFLLTLYFYSIVLASLLSREISARMFPIRNWSGSIGGKSWDLLSNLVFPNESSRTYDTVVRYYGWRTFYMHLHTACMFMFSIFVFVLICVPCIRLYIHACSRRALDVCFYHNYVVDVCLA